MLEASDRYSAHGIKPNDCDGPCEGTGVVPVPPSESRHADVWCEDELWTSDDAESVALREAWRAAEAAKKSDDGWHFVPCPRCNVEVEP